MHKSLLFLFILALVIFFIWVVEHICEIFQLTMALNCLFCADVPLSNCCLNCAPLDVRRDVHWLTNRCCRSPYWYVSLHNAWQHHHHFHQHHERSDGVVADTPHTFSTFYLINEATLPVRLYASCWSRRAKLLNGFLRFLLLSVKTFLGSILIKKVTVELDVAAACWMSSNDYTSWLNLSTRSKSSKRWLLAQAYLLKMVAIPPRMLFSIMRYAWGSAMRSNFASVCFNAMAQAREGSVMKCKQSNLWDAYLVHRKCSKMSAMRRTSSLLSTKPNSSESFLTVSSHSFHTFVIQRKVCEGAKPSSCCCSHFLGSRPADTVVSISAHFKDLLTYNGTK